MTQPNVMKFLCSLFLFVECTTYLTIIMSKSEYQLISLAMWFKLHYLIMQGLSLVLSTRQKAILAKSLLPNIFGIFSIIQLINLCFYFHNHTKKLKNILFHKIYSYKKPEMTLKIKMFLLITCYFGKTLLHSNTLFRIYFIKIK